MGMFDELTCQYPLPVPGANALLFQTKDTPKQYLDRYEIREDGTLWHQDYDVEDRSDPNATGIMRFVGCMTRVNPRWEPMPYYTGEIVFYTFKHDEEQTGWVEFSAYFEHGKLTRLNVLKNKD